MSKRALDPYKRGRSTSFFKEPFAEIAARLNPTMDDAMANVDRERSSMAAQPIRHRGVRPMSVERLLAAGGTLSLEERTRVLYHQFGDLVQVARRVGQPVAWVQDVCAWDIEQRRQQHSA